MLIHDNSRPEFPSTTRRSKRYGCIIPAYKIRWVLLNLLIYLQHQLNIVLILRDIKNNTKQINPIAEQKQINLIVE